jgi:hypothetical protein
MRIASANYYYFVLFLFIIPVCEMEPEPLKSPA